MQGGIISSGTSCTAGVAGVYWISWNSSFSNTTVPGVMPTLRPTSKADSSDCEMRPFCMSASMFCKPLVRLSPLVSMSFFCWASGFVARKLAGDMASTICCTANRIFCVLGRRLDGAGQRQQEFGIQQIGGGAEGRHRIRGPLGRGKTLVVDLGQLAQHEVLPQLHGLLQVVAAQRLQLRWRQAGAVTLKSLSPRHLHRGRKGCRAIARPAPSSTTARRRDRKTATSRKSQACGEASGVFIGRPLLESVRQTVEKRMWIVAIGWMYVVTLMAATEPTVVAGIMTFFAYGVLPLSSFFTSPVQGKRARRKAAAQTAGAGAVAAKSARNLNCISRTPSPLI
jgi:hypothetical protein